MPTSLLLLEVTWGPAGAARKESTRSNSSSWPEPVPKSSLVGMSSLSAGAGNNVKMVQESTEPEKGKHSHSGRWGGDPKQQHQSTVGPEQQRGGVSSTSGLLAQPAQPLILNTLDLANTSLHYTSSPRKDFAPLSASESILSWMHFPRVFFSLSNTLQLPGMD